MLFFPLLLEIFLFMNCAFANEEFRMGLEKINSKSFDSTLGELVEIEKLDLFKILISNVVRPPNHQESFAFVSWNETNGFDIKITNIDGQLNEWVARARFENLVNNTGWSFLEVETNTSWSDEIQMKAAGIAEGYLTKDLIYYTYKNIGEHYWDNKEKAHNLTFTSIFNTLHWMMGEIGEKKTTVPVWHHMHLIINQFHGLMEGYKRAAKGTEKDILGFNDFFYMSTWGDVGDLEESIMGLTRKDEERLNIQGSALIKLIGGSNSNKYSDIYSSHVSWLKYESMLRIIKRYKFPVHVTAAKDAPVVPGVSVTMTSYPAVLASYDDFHVTSSNLLVTQTILNIYNKELWKEVHHKSIFTVDRALIASRLATNGESWTKVFEQFQCGLSNSQWMVVDYNVFEPNKELPQNNLFWVVEEMPGINIAKDMTSFLVKQGYWASYNLPYFEEITNASHIVKMEIDFGAYFSYDKTPRAQIFARDQSNVEGLKSMINLMRYNDFKNDLLSKCDNCDPPYTAINAISSRCDLNLKNGTYPIEELGHRSNGAIDLKLTSFELNKLERFIAIGGPTYNNQPVFQWSTSDFKHLPHFGMPDRFEFKPIIYEWKWRS